ncbi:MAG: hypothetical protein ACFN38_08860 [Campylobacter sp.]
MPASADLSHAGTWRANLTRVLLGYYKTAINLTRNNLAQTSPNLDTDILAIWRILL